MSKNTQQNKTDGSGEQRGGERNGEPGVCHNFFPKKKVNRPARNYEIKVNVVIFTSSNVENLEKTTGDRK